MKQSLLLSGMFLSLCVFQAAACDLKTGYVPFAYADGAVPHDAEPKALREPEPKLIDVVRGVGGGPGSCDGSGMAIVRLKYSGGDYRLADIGFEFHVVSGQPQVQVFPDGPVALAPDIQRDELVFLWNDVAPAQQQPLRMQVEVRAVTRDHALGTVATFEIDTRDPDVIKQEQEDRRAAEKEQKRQEKEKRRAEEDRGG
jgi:hypothetical protein